MTLKEKYEQCLQDSENFISNEGEKVTISYNSGKVLAEFFNKDLDYSDINIHYSYPMEKIAALKEDWDLKIRFMLRQSEINKFAPLNAPYVFQNLSTLADSDWLKGEPVDSAAKEIVRGLKDHITPVQEGMIIKSITVEWAVHVPDCTTFYVNFLYAYEDREAME